MVSTLDASSQDIKAPKNSLYLEVFGSGGLYSINYERQVSSNLYGRFGLATFKAIDFMGDGPEVDDRITTFPVMIAYLSGDGKNHFEIAGGMLFGVKSEEEVNYKIIDLIAFIGYRYQPPVRGLIFRVGFTPFLSLDNDATYPDNDFFPSAGISIGYHF
ncbi:MAG: hypothetical protein RBS38_09210 [Bacteroidales bacterium]|jgi:hypothetical protein|nr:hypothetical protein [Bacteroidales bacterium]